jgi:hypothetical protein
MGLTERLPSAINTARVLHVVTLKTLMYSAPNGNGENSPTNFLCLSNYSQLPRDPGEMVWQSMIKT